MNSNDGSAQGPTDQAASHEALLAATLCLMTHWMNHRDERVAMKIIRNLHELATDQESSANFSVICQRLGERWCSMQTTSGSACLAATTQQLH